MQNRYLQVLQLQPGASKQDIKAAYRKLSKQYHPDRNKSADAAEKFVAINEAYRFLLQVGPYPHQEKVAYDYDPFTAEYEERRRRAYAYARQKAQEEQARQDRILVSLLRYFNYVALAIGVFNALLAIDFLLPHQEFEERIQEVWDVDYNIRGSGYHYDDIQFENFRLRVRPGEIWNFENYQKAVVVATPLLRVPVLARITFPDKTITVEQRYSVYKVFGYIIPAVFVILLFYFLLLRNSDHRLALGLMVSVMFLIQLFLYLRF